MTIRIPKNLHGYALLKEESLKSIEQLPIWAHDGGDILDTSESVHEKPMEVKIATGEAHEVTDKTYWYCFISSLDRKQDINIIKELLFWGHLYHYNDSNITILIPGWAGNQYNHYRRVFQINEVPCLIITDNKYPTDFILMSKNLINTQYLGDNFANFREILDTFHNMIINEGNLQKIQRTLIKEKLSKIIGKTWKELSNLVSINISK